MRKAGELKERGKYTKNGNKGIKDIPVYLFQPFINTHHVVLMVTRKNSYFVSIFILSQANVTPTDHEVISLVTLLTIIEV